MPMFRREDRLGALSGDKPLKEKLIYVHQLIQEEMPFIARISVALYDAQMATVKTYMHSSDQEDPLSHYQIPLDDAPSLKEIFNLGRPRVVNNFALSTEAPKSTASVSAALTMPRAIPGPF